MAEHPSAPPRADRSRRRGLVAVMAVLGLIACGGMLASAPAAAQFLNFPQQPPPKPKSKLTLEREKAGQKQMLVQASQIDYDYANHRVAAVGNVQIYYAGSMLEADRVVYDQNTKRLHAEGNVRLTDSDGKITYGTIMDLSDDYRNGFVDALRIDAPEETRFAAARAERSGGNYTVFHNGVYTACEPCKDNPKAPPEWQVRARRIVHDQTEKMIYFEDAAIQFWGHSLVWFPYFSAPDPTVKRKTGFLMPSISSSSIYGVGFEIPYYWALAPDYDVTIAPKISTKQGVLMQGEFRQRLMNGAYQIRAAGIRQQDPEYFGPTSSANRDGRGSLESEGKFALDTRWTWGWDALLLSDKYFLQDYNPSLSAYRQNPNNLSVTSEGISQLYLTGRGNRSYFDARSIYYLGFSPSDIQAEIPVIHPVIDYDYTFNHPVLGGELGYKLNFTSLSRQQANFDAITQTALTGGLNGESQCLTADPAIKTPANCVLHGIPGTYSRFSAETHWRHTFTDSIGERFTPFASVRADAASMQIDNDPSVSNFIQTGDNNLVRAMPTVGLEYRFPFIDVEPWGTQTVEPIAQVIARPDEPQIGKWPNEDAQSFIFDDSNLFRVDKFSGWDRVEGGGRANYGVQYTAQFDKGGFVNALFGQSYQLFGQNSFAVNGPANTGLDSGLDTTASDYVARLSYQPTNILTFTSRYRFDQSSFALQRLELQANAAVDRWNLSVLYGDYAAQPDLGFLDRRQGILGSASVKLNANWVLLGGARYDINDEKFDQTQIGLGYIDDCLMLALNYITGYSYSGETVVTNHQIMMQLSLRTLGTTAVTQNVDGNNASSNGTSSVFGGL
jgi:LPS-assembly protein